MSSPELVVELSAQGTLQVVDLLLGDPFVIPMPIFLKETWAPAFLVGIVATPPTDTNVKGDFVKSESPAFNLSCALEPRGGVAQAIAAQEKVVAQRANLFLQPLHSGRQGAQKK